MEGFAGVIGPDQGFIRERGERVVGERGERWGGGEAAAAGEWMAATEEERLRSGGRERRAEREGRVSHVLVEEREMRKTGRGEGREAREARELGGRGGGGVLGGGGLGVEAREVVDGGAYGGELAEEVIGDDGRDRGRWGREGGGEMVEREDVGGYHC